MSMHPVRAFRLQPLWKRIVGAKKIYRLYRGWGNDPREARRLTWRAVMR
jgi:hypothetical protein